MVHGNGAPWAGRCLTRNPCRDLHWRLLGNAVKRPLSDERRRRAEFTTVQWVIGVRADLEKWETRYSRCERNWDAPDPFLRENKRLLTSGRALDVACGRASNSLFVAKAGYSVHAVDISFHALTALQEEARNRHLDVSCFVTDLDYYRLPRSYYDLVMVFYFYAEPLMMPIADALTGGGLLVYATYNFRHTSVKPGFNPAYLAPARGLSQVVPGLEIIEEQPDAGEKRNISQLIARKRA
jgi:tellurite methyltransferase